MRVAESLQMIVSQLQKQSDSARLDAQVLVAHILEKSRAWVLAHPEIEISQTHEQALRDSLSRLSAGEPLPYVIGHWEFYGLDFELSHGTLIPRPETELIVEHALDWLRLHPGQRRVADIGTGSGCIAITLAVHNADLSVQASDLSLAALEIAQANAVKHNVEDQIQFFCADLLDFRWENTGSQLAGSLTPPDDQSIDLITANLPYIPSDRLQSLAVARHEPQAALDGGADGLDIIHRLLHQAPRALAPGGLMLVEVDASHADVARGLAQAAFPQGQVKLVADLAGLGKLVRIQLPES